MATVRPAARSMLHWEAVLQQSRLYRPQKRCFAQMVQTSPPQDAGEAVFSNGLNNTTRSKSQPYRSSLVPPRSELAQQPLKHALPPIKVHRPPPSTRDVCKEPLKVIDQAQIKLLDPTGARTRLFARTNPDAAHVGDVLLVRQKTGDPFAGVCINIRRRGADTGILLRGQLTRVGVEMWYKIYSPNVESIEVVQRYEAWKRSGKLQRVRSRPRRARLYYMRKEKHDRGSVENVVRQYQRERAALGRSGPATGKSNPKAKTKGGKR